MELLCFLAKKLKSEYNPYVGIIQIRYGRRVFALPLSLLSQAPENIVNIVIVVT